MSSWTRNLWPFAQPSRTPRPDPFRSLGGEIARTLDFAAGRLAPVAEAAAGHRIAPSADPRIAVAVSAEGAEISTVLPVRDPAGIEVLVAGDRVTIRTTDEAPSERREVRLPFAAEPHSVSARLEDGALRLSIPRPSTAGTRAALIPVLKGEP